MLRIQPESDPIGTDSKEKNRKIKTAESLKNLPSKKPLFVIRDDDISFWTDALYLEELYSNLIKDKIKLSFSVIPKSIKSENIGGFSDFNQVKNSETFLHVNNSIYDYTYDLVKQNKIEIMLHGFNHNYYLKYKNEYLFPSRELISDLKLNNKKFEFLGEFSYPSYEVLNKKVKEGKEYLEDLYKIKIQNFVPPSNQINSYGIKAISNNNLNLSGIIGKKYDREKTLIGYYSFIKRWQFRLLKKNIYPGVLDYGLHKELSAISVTPLTDIKKMLSVIDFHKKNQYPIQISTHHWEVNGHLRKSFFEMIKLISKSHKSAFLNELLK